jgi:hypothetical protein
MIILTRQEQADDAPRRWKEQYGCGRWGQDKVEIRELLNALPKPVDPNEVDRIIGNTSWTYLACSECRKDAEEVVRVGHEPDYESCTAYLCKACAKKAASIFKQMK